MNGLHFFTILMTKRATPPLTLFGAYGHPFDSNLSPPESRRHGIKGRQA